MNTRVGLFASRTKFNKNIQIQSFQADISISDTICRVEQTLTFSNKSRNYIDCIYYFPFQPLTTLFHFSSQMNSNRVSAQVKEKGQARTEFQTKKQEGATVILGQEADPHAIQFRIGNLPGKQKISICIAYCQQLRVIDNAYWKFALTSRHRPQLHTTKLAKAQVKIKHDQELTFIRSQTHPIKPHTNSKLETSFELDDFRQDFEFVFACKNMNQPKFIVDQQLARGLISFVPHFCQKDSQLVFNKESQEISLQGVRGQYIFLLDRSGSMWGKNISRAKNALLFFIKSLPPQSYFNVVSFGSRFQLMFQNSRFYDQSAVDKATLVLKKFQADFGGTQIFKPLEFVFNQPFIQGYPKSVVVLTDGQVSDIDETVLLVRKFNRRARCSCIGVGQYVSKQLLTRLSQQGKGICKFVQNQSLAEVAIDCLLNLASPVLEQVQFNFPQGLFSEVLPNHAKIPYLRKDQNVNFFVTIDRPITDADTLSLKFFNSYTNKTQFFQIKLSDFSINSLVSKLYSSRKIGMLQFYLQNQIPQEQIWQSKPVDPAAMIVNQSVKEQILCSKTSWIAVFQDDIIKARYVHNKQKAVAKYEIGEAVGGIKKPHRFRPGTVFLREIRKYRNSSQLLINRLGFRRLVKQTLSRVTDGYRIKRSAVQAMQQACQSFLVELLQSGNICAHYVERVSLKRQDLQLAYRLMTGKTLQLPPFRKAEKKSSKRALMESLVRHQKAAGWWEIDVFQLFGFKQTKAASINKNSITANTMLACCLLDLNYRMSFRLIKKKGEQFLRDQGVSEEALENLRLRVNDQFGKLCENLSQ